MLEKMKAHAGPWYVLEHLRPFPGINLETVVKQIHRGLITETSIVRGPATHHQWRFALETPGLCRYFGKCWHCFSPIGQAETHCQQCGEYLTFEPQKPFRTPVARGELATGAAGTRNGNAAGTTGAYGAAASAPQAATAPFAAARARYDADIANQTHPTGTTGSELDKLRAALSQGVITTADSRVDAPATIAGIHAGWFAAGAVVIVLAGLWWVSNNRGSAASAPPETAITAPANLAPVNLAPRTNPPSP